MDEDTARALLARVVALDRDVAAPFETVATISDEASRRRFDRATGDVTGAIARELVSPIERLHPALRPEP